MQTFRTATCVDFGAPGNHMVYLTGVLELLGAVGLMRTAPARSPVAAWQRCSCSWRHAHIYAAMEDIPLNGEAATPLWFRLPEQLVSVAVALWAAGVRVPAGLTARLRSAAPARSR